MGNVACAKLADDGSITGDNEVLVEARSLYCSDHTSPLVVDRDYQTKTEAAYLQHSSYQEQKSMVDMSEVTTFLVFQAEELLKREDEQGSQPGRKGKQDNTSRSPVREELGEPGNVATDMVCIESADDPQTSSKLVVSEVPQLLQESDDHSDNDSLQTMQNSKLSERRRIERGRRTARSLRMNENPLCGVLVCLEDPDRIDYLDRIRAHASSLYLRMPSKCSPYIQSNLARLMSEKDLIVSLAVNLCNSSPIMASGRLRESGPSTEAVSATKVPSCGPGPASRPIGLLVSGLSFMDLAIAGSLGLTKTSTKRKHIKVRAPDRFLVLMNRQSGVPLAVCAKEIASESGTPNIRIFSTSRRMYAQPHAATTRQLGLDWCSSQSLYSWAEIATKGTYPDKVTYTIFLATGSDGMFEALPTFKATHDPSTPAEILVSRWNDRTDTYTGCAVFSLSRDAEENVFFRLAIMRGIDPALMLCFAAIIDEGLAKVMRQQFARLKTQYQV